MTRKRYDVILSCGEILTKEADSLAELIEILKMDGVKYKDVALMWLRVEVYEYHWR